MIAYHANCWGPLGGDAVGVTSIARLTYRTFADMGRAIREIGEAGYAGTELFDGNVLDYEDRLPELGAILNGAGVRLVGVYSGCNFIFPEILSEELARVIRAADAAAELRAPQLVVGGGARRASGIEEDDYRKLGAALEQVVEIARARGLQAHFHPHLSTIVETPDQIRRTFRETSIHFCPDTAHLAAAGGDPAELIREHKERISYVHLKGWQKEPFAFTPLGSGDLDMQGVMQSLREIDYRGWITVELDSWPDPKAAAVQSLEFLRRHQGQP